MCTRARVEGVGESEATPQEGRGRARRVRSWGGYGWFMSFGTFLPLPVFVAGYLAQLTFVGAPPARRAYRLGIFLSTLGQKPPGADRQGDDARRGGPWLA